MVRPADREVSDLMGRIKGGCPLCIGQFRCRDEVAIDVLGPSRGRGRSFVVDQTRGRAAGAGHAGGAVWPVARGKRNRTGLAGCALGRLLRNSLPVPCSPRLAVDHVVRDNGHPCDHGWLKCLHRLAAGRRCLRLPGQGDHRQLRGVLRLVRGCGIYPTRRFASVPRSIRPTVVSPHPGTGARDQSGSHPR